MPKAYWITCYREIKDRQGRGLRQAGGAGAGVVRRALSLLRHRQHHLAARLKHRVVVSEFPSLNQAIAAHNRPVYQEALEALGDGAVRDIRIIEGLE